MSAIFASGVGLGRGRPLEVAGRLGRRGAARATERSVISWTGRRRKPEKPPGRNFTPTAHPLPGEDADVAAAVDAVDGRAVRLEDEVDARVRDDLLAVRRAVAEVPLHDPVALDRWARSPAGGVRRSEKTRADRLGAEDAARRWPSDAVASPGGFFQDARPGRLVDSGR